MSTNLREMMLATYGPVMDSKSMCKVLYYPSVAALLAAKSRGLIPFRLVELRGRRGYFGLTEQIAAYLESSFDEEMADEGTARNVGDQKSLEATSL